MADKAAKPIKAYKNVDFLESREARMIRIICEFEETVKRLRENNVKETIMFFGSARARTTEKYKQELEEAQKALQNAKTDEEKQKAEEVLARMDGVKWLCGTVDMTVELSRRLTEWAMTYESTAVVGGGFLARDGAEDPPKKKPRKRSKKSKPDNQDNSSSDMEDDNKPFKQSLMICTGGGPGLMEAANMGAAMVPGAKNIGMKITLPFEEKHNPHITPELCFQYHYFFTRKYWMLFACRALVVAPGGFGTMDELFELLTLKQSGKIAIDVPIVLIGVEYWNSVMNLKAAVKYGTISQRHYDSLFFTDSVEDAFEYITRRVLELRDQHSVSKKTNLGPTKSLATLE